MPVRLNGNEHESSDVSDSSDYVPAKTSLLRPAKHRKKFKKAKHFETS